VVPLVAQLYELRAGYPVGLGELMATAHPLLHLNHLFLRESMDTTLQKRSRGYQQWCFSDDFAADADQQTYTIAVEETPASLAALNLLSADRGSALGLAHSGTGDERICGCSCDDESILNETHCTPTIFAEDEVVRQRMIL
jgi:hypothetical protein